MRECFQRLATRLQGVSIAAALIRKTACRRGAGTRRCGTFLVVLGLQLLGPLLLGPLLLGLVFFGPLQLGLPGMTPQANAQVSGVSIEIRPTDIGLEGRVHPGNWLPIRVRLTNQASTPRDVVCRFIYPDGDGDPVQAQRAVVLSPADDTQAATDITWLYGHPQNNLSPTFRVDVVDAQTQRLLASAEPSPVSIRERGTQAIGICGPSHMGLAARIDQPGTHDRFVIQPNLSLATLPDHWLGYRQLDTLIWTPLDVPPTDAAVPDAVLDAIREWVYRGGRFVIVLPSRNQTWTQIPGWADALPVAPAQIRPDTAELNQLVRFLGAARLTQAEPIPVNQFTADAAGNPPAGAVLRGQDGRIYGTTGRYGFGAVTLVGVDLTQTALAKLGLPATDGDWPFWNLLLGDRGPVIDPAVSERYVRGGFQTPAGRLDVYGLGGVIGQTTAMTGQVATGLTAAVVLFAVYFLVAGVLMERTLRKKGLGQHAWLAFAATALVFTLVAWTGAWGLSNHRLSGNHVSVVDIDDQTDTARVRSWASVLTPGFRQAAFEITPPTQIPSAADGLDLLPVLYNPALPNQSATTGYLDPQAYTLGLNQTHRGRIPVRSTTKRLAIDYTGDLTRLAPGLPVAVNPLTGGLSAEYDAIGFPRLSGSLQHDLPGTLQNVLIIVCPGPGSGRNEATTRPDQRQPWIWSPPNGTWAPNTPLDLRPPGAPGALSRLVQAPRAPGSAARVDLPVITPGNNSQNALNQLLNQAGGNQGQAERVPATRWDRRAPGTNGNEGYLGLFASQAAGESDLPIYVDAYGLNLDTSLNGQLLRLSFFDRLPPPVFRNTDPNANNLFARFRYARWMGHELDLSHLLDEPRIIVMGHLPNSTLPVPLTVDGQDIATAGHTLFRFLLDPSQP